jgi:hypothetical protein
MFKPHRFNPLLKAQPNVEHEQQVANKHVHGRTHEELLKEVEVKQTTVVGGGETTTTKEVVGAEVTTKETPAGHGKVQKTTDVEAVAEVTKTTTPDHHHRGGGTETTDIEAVEEVTKTTTPDHHHRGGGTETTDIEAATEVTKTTTTTPSHKHDGGETVVETTEVLSRVHATTEGVAAVEMTPPHPPREETPEYVRAHHHLTRVLDSPCAMCGVRNSTLKDPKENPFGATALETHHYPIERSLLDACDPLKVGVVFPQVKDQASLEEFVDSEHNLMVLCDIHHRHPLHGIHHLTPQDFFVQPFLLEGYQVVATQQDEAQAMQADEILIESETKIRK